MKKITLIFAALFFVTVGMMAQEVASEKKETVTKKVITKGTNVETKVIKEVTEVKEVMKLEENGAVNQKADEKVVLNSDDKIITQNTEKNKESEAAIEKMKAERQAKIQKKRDDLLDRARKEGRLTDDTKADAERMKKLEAQKKKYAERKKNAAKKKTDNN